MVGYQVIRCEASSQGQIQHQIGSQLFWIAGEENKWEERNYLREEEVSGDAVEQTYSAGKTYRQKQEHSP